jgi:hypothetical protein
VVRLVPVAQALEDLDGVRDRRLRDLDGLEPALESSVRKVIRRKSDELVKETSYLPM